MEPDDIKLDILISTIGAEGIRRVVANKHPQRDGVRYVVCWQQPDSELPVPEELQRDDFSIYVIKSKGLSRNRNHALKLATAPYILISDDDVEYNQAHLNNIVHAINKYTEKDIITFKYDSLNSKKNYPEFSFDLNNPPFGYHVSSIEIALKRETTIASGVRFDTSFGLGARFPAGEEILFISRLLKKGLKGIYVPAACCRHDAPSTGEQTLTQEFIRAKGALFKKLYPISWFPRMISHAFRHNPHLSGISTWSYLRNWMSGAFS